MVDRKTRSWEDPTGRLFHDECFDDNETREGFEPANLNELDDEAECHSCGGLILAGLADVDVDDDDEGQEEETVEAA